MTDDYASTTTEFEPGLTEPMFAERWVGAGEQGAADINLVGPDLMAPVQQDTMLQAAIPLTTITLGTIQLAAIRL